MCWGKIRLATDVSLYFQAVTVVQASILWLTHEWKKNCKVGMMQFRKTVVRSFSHNPTWKQTIKCSFCWEKNNSLWAYANPNHSLCMTYRKVFKYYNTLQNWAEHMTYRSPPSQIMWYGKPHTARHNWFHKICSSKWFLFPQKKKNAVKKSDLLHLT